MRLGTIRGGGRDGTLVVVGGANAVVPPDGPRSLREAIEDWSTWEPRLEKVSGDLERGALDGSPTEQLDFLSPLPRSFQWCEGSTYLAHMERIRRARGLDLPPGHGSEPVIYQSGSSYLAPTDDIPLVDAEYALDIEGTISVVTDDVPMGTSYEGAGSHIKLLLLANDLTYRNLIPCEYENRVGFYRSKPQRTFAPFAVTSASLGDSWKGWLLRSEVRCTIRGEEFGHPDSAADAIFDFARLIEYATLTRPLDAGCIVGSGTVSNREESRGYTCIAERRAVETAKFGTPFTDWLHDGDEISLEAFIGDWSVFGAIRQHVRQVARELSN